MDILSLCSRQFILEWGLGLYISLPEKEEPERREERESARERERISVAAGDSLLAVDLYR